MTKFVCFLMLSLTTLIFHSTVAQSKDVKMTGEEMSALLSSGKTLNLGGKDQGYTGTLVLSADGKGEGSAKPDSGSQIKLSGTWKITNGKFCRIWVDLDDGKEICETWIKAGPTAVKVFKGKKQIGFNSW